MASQDKGKPDASGKTSSERPKPVPKTLSGTTVKDFVTRLLSVLKPRIQSREWRLNL